MRPYFLIRRRTRRAQRPWRHATNSGRIFAPDARSDAQKRACDRYILPDATVPHHPARSETSPPQLTIALLLASREAMSDWQSATIGKVARRAKPARQKGLGWRGRVGPNELLALELSP